MNLYINAITGADASNACSVVRRSITECCLADHQGNASTINSWLANKTPENFEAWLSAPKSIAFGAYLDQTLVGIVLVSGSTVALCYVIPEVLHKGVGRALLAQAQSCAVSVGVEYLELESTRTAEAFYARNGFEPSGPLQSWENLKAQPMRKRVTPPNKILPRELTAARRVGEIRYSFASESTGNLSRLLGKFGLLPDETLLVEHDRESARQILVALLWKDMAYDGECMPKETAESLARKIIAENERPGCRFFSNGNLAKGESWNPLTESTFDAGLLITDPMSGNHFCIWIQDED